MISSSIIDIALHLICANLGDIGDVFYTSARSSVLEASARKATVALGSL